ncbi:MAG TPA: hypothetical protein VFM21_03110 [Terriglobia bacterium]|nr:hypothetical protein [Terriglobia bacterium]
MQADFSVELGADDRRLEVPWTSEDGSLRYYDLKRQPELLLQIEEAHHNRELGEFLSAVNSPGSMLETAKCDTWTTDEILPEEEIYGAPWKYSSYIDLIFSDPHPRLSFEGHQNFSHRLVRLLHKVPEISAAAEFIVRRCSYHRQALSAGAAVNAAPIAAAESSTEGFYFTLYLSGYGDDSDEARRHWGIALKLVENAILQLSATHRRGADQTAPVIG